VKATGELGHHLTGNELANRMVDPVTTAPGTDISPNKSAAGSVEPTAPSLQMN